MNKTRWKINDYFVKLVNEAESFIGQDEGTSFEGPFSGDGRSLDVGRQTDGGGSLASGEHGAGCDFLHVLEKLRFGRSRIAANQDVQIPADSMLLTGVFRLAAEYRQRYRSFYVLQKVNFDHLVVKSNSNDRNNKN